MMGDKRTVFVLFSDDVRQEVGNKLSLIGCYSDELVVERMPTVLPKLCVFVKATTACTKPFQKLAVRANLNDEVIGEIEVPHQDLESAAARVLNGPRSNRMTMTVLMAFAPVSVTEPGVLRIETETEDGIIEDSQLQLRERAGSEAPSA